MKRNERFSMLLCVVLMTAVAGRGTAQEAWNMDDCMNYAVVHAHRVQRSAVEAENARLEMERSRGAFIPSLNAGVGGQLSWGRNVDPETNTYNTITTLNNSYQLSTGLTLWDGMQSVNTLKQARLQLQQSRNALQESKDQVAMETMRCFIDALYAERSAELACRKEEDSQRLLELTRRMHELGTRGLPDVAQMEAQLANDSYEAVRQTNLARTAMNALKTVMNFTNERMPSLAVQQTDTCPATAACSGLSSQIPALVSAENSVRLQQFNYRMVRGRFSPTLSLGAGVGTGYYRNLSSGSAVGTFGRQWKNNMGEYVNASLSIPLFNFGRHKDIRRARNQIQIARINRDEKRFAVQEAYRQACDNVCGSHKELQLMQTKVQSDSIAHRLNCRRYEEGLLSALDLQTSAQTLHQSRIRLLQVMLTLSMQQRVKKYYETAKIYDEQYGQKD